MSASLQTGPKGAAPGLIPAPRDAVITGLAAFGLLLCAAVLLTRGSYLGLALLAVTATLGAIFLAVEFGYTSSYRAWLGKGDGSNLAAGLLVAAIAAILIVPMGEIADGYNGLVSPVGVPVLGGAALFGIGMQLANGCGSGCLYKAGGGSPSLLIALPLFCAGGLLGSLAFPALQALPAIPPLGLGDLLGPWWGLAATLAIIGGMIAILLRHGPRPSTVKTSAAIAIGILAALVFLISGQPWGVTMGLTVWGAKIATTLGLDLSHTTFWNWDGPKGALQNSILASDSSLADIGMLLGAAMLAGWRGSFRNQSWPGFRVALAAAIGGLLMGFGARLSFGCNIGALVGGIASGSLHGLAWFLAAIPGSLIGMRLRPLFGLARV